MQFKKETPLYSFEVMKEGGEDVLYLNYLGAPYVPSLADSGEIMSRTVDALIENSNISRVVFVQQRNYNYDVAETSYLIELAQVYTYLVKQERVLSPEKLVLNLQDQMGRRHNALSYLLLVMKQDPILAYHELKRLLMEERIILERAPLNYKADEMHYIRLLEKISSLLQGTRIMQLAMPYLEDYKRGDREIYNRFFKVDVIPNFTFTRLVSDLPEGAEIVDQYTIAQGTYDESTVTVMRRKDDTKLVYHLMPPEYNLTEDFHMLLNLARSVLIEHQPKAEEFVDTDRTRQVFFNISRDLVQDLASSKNIKIKYNDLNKLATILVRHTIGFGLIEVLLQDKYLQDIVLNAPISLNPVFIMHERFEECVTNILPSQEDANSWAAKFRLISGRPLDEANPILDTQITIGKLSARVAIIQEPLSPTGLAYALRRHRENPWTLSLFVKNKMINSLSAGLLSFLIDGSRTLLIAGTRSSGKTSLLGSLMLEIMPRYRIIVVEDTLELPVDSMRELKYNILRMKVRSALLKTSTEVEASEGIRTSLRLGDSSLIVGEVRSGEAQALYEAMRIGALANVVAGTIHGASPYAVFDRVVNDLKVPVTSFKATDLIVVANPIKSPDGLHNRKRVLQLTEVRKHWTQDPELEKGFIDLMRYNVEKDELEPTPELINGESEIIKDIASKVRGWAGIWDAIYDNILLRAKIKQEIVDMSEKLKMPELLEAKFNVLSNNAFHIISDVVSREIGLPMSDRVFPLWQKWLKEKIKAKAI